ncbi:MAG: hypothetical protein ABFD82_07700 [Syntrophaceae bacterium]
MKKEEKRSEENGKNQEEELSDSETDIGEYGFEYDFFVTEKNSMTDKISTLKTNETRDQIKAQESIDQSKTFFLPDFFSHED